ncbi:unnamed protein product [Arctia plantaginis]|uniref:Uncharacterized protein n=1 Tax=Arctia plantaginis TaxID=874455 RepID=A0A8S0YWR5_ARCPL|nr:unnamed protein product [Arctia plantaginis]
MSVAREEDRQKNGCPSRGLGVAAAAIGVGVGAALYYFFNKRAEQPNTEGSTSDWNCQRPQPFRERSWTLEDCSICFDVMRNRRAPCAGKMLNDLTLFCGI